MLGVTSESRKGTEARQSITVPLQADHQTSYGHNAISERDARLDALRRSFAIFGLNLHQLSGGSELCVTGPGASGEAFPDHRSAVLYLRMLRGGVR